MNRESRHAPNQKQHLSGPVIALGALLISLLGFGLLSLLFPGLLRLSSPAPPENASEPKKGGTAPALSTKSPGSTAQQVSLTAPDGIQLEASYYAATPATQPLPALLLLHMAYRDRTDWNSFAAEAQQAGYHVLALDLRGHGHSQGEKQFAPLMDADVATALDWLAHRPEVDADRIAIYGASFGASLALRAAANHPPVKTVALLSPGINLWEVGLDGVMARYGQRPVLLVASAEDEYPAESVKLLDEQALGEHRLQLYPGSAHGTDMLAAHPELSSLLLEWLQQTLPSTIP